MTWIGDRTVGRRCLLGMVIRALNTRASEAGHGYHALLPTRVIAGHGTTPSRDAAAIDRAPWIGVGRLGVAIWYFTQQHSGRSYKKRSDWHPHQCLPIVVLLGPHVITLLRPWNEHLPAR